LFSIGLFFFAWAIPAYKRGIVRSIQKYKSFIMKFVCVLFVLALVGGVGKFFVVVVSFSRYLRRDSVDFSFGKDYAVC
jgi:uncharacterized protein involved in cysteine biosynthesis